MDDLSFSVEGLLFFGDFLYHKAHNLSANGQKKIGNKPQRKSAILKIVPISSNHCLHSCNSAFTFAVDAARVSDLSIKTRLKSQGIRYIDGNVSGFLPSILSRHV